MISLLLITFLQELWEVCPLGRNGDNIKYLHHDLTIIDYIFTGVMGSMPLGEEWLPFHLLLHTLSSKIIRQIIFLYSICLVMANGQSAFISVQNWSIMKILIYNDLLCFCLQKIAVDLVAGRRSRVERGLWNILPRPHSLWRAKERSLLHLDSLTFAAWSQDME